MLIFYPKKSLKKNGFKDVSVFSDLGFWSSLQVKLNMESLTLIFMLIRETAADRATIDTFDLNLKCANLNVMIMVRVPSFLEP